MTLNILVYATPTYICDPVGMDLERTPTAAAVVEHPCIQCGACCASFRVAFYWREGEVSEHDKAVPKDLWEDLTPEKRCMKGTLSKHKPRCVALRGKIGERAMCSIYENRSSTCRRFKASYEDGYHNPRCDEARAKHGLAPLTKQIMAVLKEYGSTSVLKSVKK